MNKNDFGKIPADGLEQLGLLWRGGDGEGAAAECRLYGGAFEGAWLGVCRL